MKQSKRIILATTALVVTAILLTCTTLGAISFNKNISTSGTITVAANLGVYSDSTCQNALTTFNWGTITPGGMTTQTIFIKNIGTGISLALNMTTSNWSPSSANGPITITWNQENTRLSPGQSVAAVITLTASSSIVDITSFNVQITITGNQ